MEVTRAYKFRIYPDAARQQEIDERLVIAQQFYNKILEKSIASYQNGKTKVSMAQFNSLVKEIIQEDKKYLKLYSQTRCEIEFRLMKAYQNFFRRIREGNKKVLHEDVYNPMLDTTRKLPVIIRAIPISTSKGGFFFITSLFVHLCIS